MLDIIRTFWPIVSFLAVGLGGWGIAVVLKQHRTAWRLDQVEKDLAALKSKQESLTNKHSLNDVNMQVIEVSLGQIKEVLSEIRADLKGKVDK